ncbi:carboxypeptidase [Eremomyces bilateralis CBS 781.70]|uniref:Carboxypeptidase n=1 Tax=Eremomyces bilateralis CBS 781.70 TaxID=1392243 RepID=A0A6G1G433_9PEZI|nr:carboxypeptidase [Eremomyces bilateralis CBS 781.70]KAF1812824.1 carboxypeptidase [Eremomyces bilateralis CBS 781.70]
MSSKHPYDPYPPIPIPTYEEATSSRPPSSTHLGPSEISADAERQSFLAPASRRRTGYHAPSVQSVRSSTDTADYLPDPDPNSDTDTDTDDGDGDRLRRDMEELEVLDPDADEADGARRRRRARTRFSKRLASFTSRFSGWRMRRPTWAQGLRWPSGGWSIPQDYRPRGIILARLAGLFVLMALVYSLFVLQMVPGNGGVMFSPESVRAYAQGRVEEGRIREYARHLSGFDHVAGSKGDAYMARWVEGLFREAGLQEVETERFNVYLNYPKKGGRRVAIVDPPELAWEAKLEEDEVYPNAITPVQQVPAFHGHSRAGDVSGPLIYVNYGSRKDYKRLADSGIDMNGSIALVRYYGTQGDRALKVKAAEEWGFKGVLIYSDPEEDGFVKGDVWPEGRWRPADSVQRGAVSLMSWVVGDVLTPGWASVDGAKRVSKDNNPGLVNIPSLPLAWRDAQRLLQVLKGHGQQLPEEWIGGVPDVEEWWSGDKTSPVVQLKNEQDEVDEQPIFNVLGEFPGIETTAKKVIVGNHRDAWCFGAADPGSGTAVMLEVIRIFGDLWAEGWRPLRTIQFASWDGEEYNLIGSTEHVENRIDDLRKDAIAYLNVDVGVTGSKFWAAASPLFQDIVLRAIGRVEDPGTNSTSTVREQWETDGGKLRGLGAGSDYVAFQDLAGCSSIDFGFEGPGFPYHSCYETFEWMEQYGDPGFQYHKSLAQIWALMILELTQENIIPFDLTTYASAVAEYIEALETYANEKGAPWSPDKDGVKFDVEPLATAADGFTQNANSFHAWEQTWRDEVFGRGGFEANMVMAHRIAHNEKMSDFETNLLDLPTGPEDTEQHGVPGREQFKHIIFGPQLWSGYDEAYFPAIRDAVDAGDWALAQKQLEKAARILRNASERLLV